MKELEYPLPPKVIYPLKEGVKGGGSCVEPRDVDHLGQHGETLSLLKIQKLAGRGGMCL